MESLNHKITPGQTLTGKHGVYQVEQALGQGGFGLTFRARRQRDGASVVVKQLRLERLADWKAVELFEREGAVLRGLSHPGIPEYVDSFGLGEPEPVGFVLVQSFVEGQTLRERLRIQRRMGPEAMLHWLWRMLEICQYLHTRHPPVIHRDINPKNIILTPAGDAVLIDFGTVQAKLASQHTVSSTSAGTFGYAPPEQFVGRATPGSDLYGLAVTFLAVATGNEPEELPFVGARIDVRKALTHVDVDPRIVLALLHMTEADPEQRANDAAAIMRKLEPLRARYRPAPTATAAPSDMRPSAAPLTPAGSQQALASSGDAAPSLPPSSPGAPLVPPVPMVQSRAVAQAMARAAEASQQRARWQRARQRLERIPPDTIWRSRPALPLGDLESIACNDAGTHVLLVSYHGLYALELDEMRVHFLGGDHIASRTGGFSADGHRLLAVDYYNRHLYFVELEPGTAPTARVVRRDELQELDSEVRVAVSPDYRYGVVGNTDEDTPMVLLLDWQSGDVLDRFEFDTSSGLSFSPDGQYLICSGYRESRILDIRGGEERLSGSQVTLSPDGQYLAAYLHEEAERGDEGLYFGRVTSLSPLSWQTGEAFRLPSADWYIEQLRFSPDSRSLAVRCGLGNPVTVIDVAGRTVAAQVGEPHGNPERPRWTGEYAGATQLGFTRAGHLLVHGTALANRYMSEPANTLMFYRLQPELDYLGDVKMVKREARQSSILHIGGRSVGAEEARAMGIEIQQAGHSPEVVDALARVAGGPNDPHFELPYGESPAGFFGRLDDAGPIGIRGWMTPYERPAVVRRALAGHGELEGLDELDRLRGEDVEERQSFWHELQMQARARDVRKLVDASVGLTDLLPAIAEHAKRSAAGQPRFGKKKKGGRKAANRTALLHACREFAGQSVDERQVRFEDMISEFSAVEAEAARVAREEAERQAREEAERRARAEAERRAREEAERRAREEAERQIQIAMERERVAGELEQMGLGGQKYRLLLLLPVFEVAWSDGKLQRKEATAIVDVAKKRSLLRDEDSQQVMDLWLASPPPQGYFDHGYELLLQLSANADYPDITTARIDASFRLCQEVASASGGFLGFGSRVSAAENTALERVARALRRG